MFVGSSGGEGAALALGIAVLPSGGHFKPSKRGIVLPRYPISGAALAQADLPSVGSSWPCIAPWFNPRFRYSNGGGVGSRKRESSCGCSPAALFWSQMMASTGNSLGIAKIERNQWFPR